MEPSQLSPRYIIPVGTQVVLTEDLPLANGDFKKEGSVGLIERAPPTRQGVYVVRFADDRTVEARHDQLAVRRTIAPEDALPERGPTEYEPYLIYRAVLGSKAYGLAGEGSDEDERGIFLPPAAWHWSLAGLPEQVEFKVTPDGVVVDSNRALEGDDFCWWELEKFLRLALKANPTALEVLYVGESGLVSLTDVGRRLRDLRAAFLSKHLYHTYSGYVLSQFRRMKRAEKKGKAYRPKHAMHLVRLLYSGIEALRGGGILVDVGERREELLEIKRSRPPLEEIHRRALELAARFQKEFERTSLPDRPDVRAVDEFLIEARRSRV